MAPHFPLNYFIKLLHAQQLTYRKGRANQESSGSLYTAALQPFPNCFSGTPGWAQTERWRWRPALGVKGMSALNMHPGSHMLSLRMDSLSSALARMSRPWFRGKRGMGGGNSGLVLGLPNCGVMIFSEACLKQFLKNNDHIYQVISFFTMQIMVEQRIRNMIV